MHVHVFTCGYCHQCGILLLKRISGTEFIPDLLDWWTGTERLSWQGPGQSGTASPRGTAGRTKMLHNISSNYSQCRRHLMTIRVELGEVGHQPFQLMNNVLRDNKIIIVM